MTADDDTGPRRCLNCEAALAGEYCSACGQRDMPSRLAIGELLREVLSETFELDGRVWRTLVPFLIKPGELTREYVAGRRARYTSPFRLFLAATLLWLAASYVAGQRVHFEASAGEPATGFSVGVPTDEDSPSALDDWLRERGEALGQLSQAELGARFVDAGRETLPKSALLTIPIFALLMKLLFIRQERYYVEHLVFALHVHAFAFVSLGIAALFGHDLIVNLLVLALFVYLYLSLWRAYEARWWTSALRLVALVVVHGFVLLVTTGIMVVLTMLMA